MMRGNRDTTTHGARMWEADKTVWSHQSNNQFIEPTVQNNINWVTTKHYKAQWRVEKKTSKCLGLVIWSAKIVPDMTYNVFGGTLNLAQSQSAPTGSRWGTSVLQTPLIAHVGKKSCRRPCADRRTAMVRATAGEDIKRRVLHNDRA